jgi:hypothetical protein
MADTALEPMRTMPLLYDWYQPGWRNREYEHIQRLAWQAGWHAYQGPGWTYQQITDEAERFLRESLLLAPLAADTFVHTLATRLFGEGWRTHERRSQSGGTP